MIVRDITLPKPITEGGATLLEALSKRISARDFSSKELDLQTLSNILWAAWGYNRERKRTAPSSHNRQDIEIYVALSHGVYLWDAVQNILKCVLEEDIRATTGMQEFVEVAPVNLIFVSDTTKIKGKDERGVVEAIFANTGYISQNIYLWCAANGLITVARAMVDREKVAKTLALSATSVVTLTQTVGYPQKAEL